MIPVGYTINTAVVVCVLVCAVGCQYTKLALAVVLARPGTPETRGACIDVRRTDRRVRLRVV